MNNESEKESFDELKALAKDKLSLAQLDYKNYFENISSQYGSIQNLRQWQITILSALFVLVLKDPDISKHFEPFLSLVLLMILFLILELNLRTWKNINLEYVQQLEKKLQEGTPEKFYDNLVNWRFSFRLKANISMITRLRCLKEAIKERTFWVWYVALALGIYFFFFRVL